MKKIWQIAIICMLLLPVVAKASANVTRPVPYIPAVNRDLTTTYELNDNNEIDPSFEKVDFEIKEIVIYPYGIVLIRKEATVGSGNKFYTEFEGSAFPGCVRILEDESLVKEITIKNGYRIYSTSTISPFNINMLLRDNVGSLVELVASDAFYKGEILGVLNGYIFLRDVKLTRIFGEKIEQRNASFICLKLVDILNIILMDEPNLPDFGDEEKPSLDNSPKTRISWEDTGGSTRKVTLLYMISGISWKSEYFLDTFTPFEGQDEDDARLEHWAIINNNLDFDLIDVNVRLVAGDIKLQNPGVRVGSDEYMMNAAQLFVNTYDGNRGSSSSSSQPSIMTMEEYEVYTLPYKLTLKRGETKKVQIQTCDVEIVEEYVYDATHFTPRTNSYRTWEGEAVGKVKKILKLKNNGKTWPEGLVHVYKDYMIIGQDGIQWTPNGREAKVTIGVASDIVAKKKATVIETSPDRRHDHDYKYTITIELVNYKDEQVSVKVFDNFVSDAIDLTSNPDFEEKPGNQMEWEITLESGKDKKIVYTYETRH
jgi:hypothetical protein